MTKWHWLVVASGILSGFIVFGGQVFANLGLSLYEISILPYAVVTISLMPFVFMNKKYHLKISNIWTWALYGLVAALTTLGQYAAVIVGLPVAMVVLLLYTQPLWTVVFSHFFMKERATKQELLALAVVMIGMVVLVNPFGASLDSINWLGVTIALLSGVSLSGWIVVGSFLSKTHNEPMTSKFAESVSTLVFVALSYPLVKLLTNDGTIVNFSLSWPTAIWLWIILFGLVTGVVNHLAYLHGVRKVKTVDAGIIMLLEPVSAAILAILFLNQAITINVLIGGLLILSANYLTIKEPALTKEKN